MIALDTKEVKQRVAILKRLKKVDDELKTEYIPTEKIECVDTISLSKEEAEKIYDKL